jgi:UDP-2,3-diacylglucosamine hydrolase
LPMTIDLGQSATYVNLGDWITHYTFSVYDGETLTSLTSN